MKIRFDNNILGIMKKFEQVTHSRLKDCISEEDRIIFVVYETEARKAIGDKGANVKRLAEIFRKKIKIVEFSSDLFTLIKNFIHPLKVSNITEEDGIVIIEGSDVRTRGLLIGRAAQNLRQLEEYIRRYLPVKEIKVV